MSSEKPRFTEEQQAAIDYDGKNLLLAAAAGSGKTATLTERIAKLILERGADIERMLVITFTKAAAGELRGRIKKRLKDEYSGKIYTEPTKRRLIKKQLDKVGYAKICTIDSFLYSEIRQYLPLIGISADARIITDDDVRELEEEVISETVQEKYAETDENERRKWMNLCDVISQTRDTNRIDEELLLIADKIERAGIDPSDPTNIQVKGKNLSDTIIAELRERVKRALLHSQEECIKIRESVKAEGGETLKYLGNIEDDISVLEDALLRLKDEQAHFDGIRNALDGIKFGRLATVKAERRTPLCEEYRLIRDEVKRNISELKDEICKYSEIICEQQNAQSEEIQQTLYEILAKYAAKLGERKNSSNIMTYADLERYAHRLICERDDLGAAAKIGAKYDYVFIDEYQDTNSLQDDIISAISTKSNRFMVGDIKQAIYRFRGGDPKVFSRYRLAWSGSEKENNAGEALFLRKNFRCARSIIDFTNMVTNCLFGYSDVAFTEDDLLVMGRVNDGEEAKVSVNLIDISQTEESGVPADEAEAEFIARDIAGRIRKYDPAVGKIIGAEDIAVIMRSPGARGEKYRKRLVERGIAAKTKASGVLFEFPVVRLMIAIIRTIDNPMVDEYFAGVLYSSIFGFDIDDISEVRKYAGEMPLYYGVKKITDEDAVCEIAERCKEVEKWLNRYRSYSEILPIHRLLEMILRTEEIEFSPEAEAAGSDDAIKAIRTVAKTYEKEFSAAKYGNDLGEFADYFENKTKEKTETGNESAGNAVSIISIHASKGLEYPIVYLAETDRKRNRADESAAFLVDPELGVGTYLPHSSGVTVVDTLKRRVIAKRISRDKMYEEMRLLYVAMTRARDRLIVTGRSKNPEKLLSEASIHARYIDEVQIANNDDYLSWILMSCFSSANNDSYGIKVITGEYFDNTEVISGGETEVTEESEEDEEEKDTQNEEYIYKNSDIALIPAKLPAAKLEVGVIDRIISGDYVFSDEEDENNEDKKSVKDIENDNKDSETDENVGNGNKLAALPKFMTGLNEYDAARRGTAFHSFMQFMELENLREHGAEAELERLVEKRYISEKSAEQIELKDIDKFIHSSLFKAMLDTDFMKREFRFNCCLDADRFALSPELKEKLRENGTKITVQGVVDCILRVPAGENKEKDDTSAQSVGVGDGKSLKELKKFAGKLVIIDYKTDFAPREIMRDGLKLASWCRERHGGQLEIYRELCERIFEEKIEGKFIYLTRLGRLIEI